MTIVFFLHNLSCNTGCISGLGSGKILSNGLGGGGGHGGKGGYGYYNGSFIEGGVTYGNADLPCELGSGSGNYSLPGATAGGGIIGNCFHAMILTLFCSLFGSANAKAIVKLLEWATLLAEIHRLII